MNRQQLPKKSDDVLPDSTSPYGPCPRCGRLSNFTVEGRGPVTYTDQMVVGQSGRTERLFDEQVSILRCNGCGQNTVVEEEYLGGVRRRDGGNSGLCQWRGVRWWPTIGMRRGDPDVPQRVSDAISEGARCVAVKRSKAPRAAAVMYRAAVAEIVTDRGSPASQAKGSLADQLKQMANDGDLDRTTADWADYVRIVGNAGAHPNELAPVTLEEVEGLGRLINVIVDYLYVHPARVRRARGSRS